MTNTHWLVPWRRIEGGRADDPVVQELYREVSAGHILYGLKARPIAQRQDCDDVLFQLLDGSGRFAVVHLTYAQHPEPDPRWPERVIYREWTGFLQAMKADADDWHA